MRHILFLLFSISLLFTLPAEARSSASSLSRGMPGTALKTDRQTIAGTAKVEAMLATAGLSGAVLTGADHNEGLPAEVSSECKNRSNKAKKACTKRKCLKHHQEDSFPAGEVPAPVCSISLFAVISQPEDFRFSAPAALAGHLAFHPLILLSPDLEQDPQPPRYS